MTLEHNKDEETLGTRVRGGGGGVCDRTGVKG